MVTISLEASVKVLTLIMHDGDGKLFQAAGPE